VSIRCQWKDVHLYTPQLLFGEVGTSTDTLTHEPFLERARLQREQEHDGSARLALGAYVVARLVDKLVTLDHEDAEQLEGFRWQLEAVRRHVSELPGDAPETAHLAGVVAAVPPQWKPASGLWMSLTAYAYFLEHEGRLEEALELLTLAARSQGSNTPVGDFTTYALFAGRLNRLLARWEAASTCYAAAEAAASGVDPVSVLRGRLGLGAVQRGRGNYPAARATAESVVREASELQLTDAQALAYADLGLVYSLQGLKLEALEAHYRAFRLTRDPQQRMRTLVDVAIGLHEIGALDAARVAFQTVANSTAGMLVRANSLVELMDLESTSGNRVAFERCRAAAEAYRSRMSPSMSVDYHYKLGIGLSRFEQVGRACDTLTAGLALAESHGLNAWYFKIEQALGELSKPPEPKPVDQRASRLSEAPAVRQMEVELREYAASAAL
jgi:tetratricopeptide (TPR) repeat protein